MRVITAVEAWRPRKGRKAGSWESTGSLAIEVGSSGSDVVDAVAWAFRRHSTSVRLPAGSYRLGQDDQFVFALSWSEGVAEVRRLSEGALALLIQVPVPRGRKAV